MHNGFEPKSPKEILLIASIFQTLQSMAYLIQIGTRRHSIDKQFLYTSNFSFPILYPNTYIYIYIKRMQNIQLNQHAEARNKSTLMELSREVQTHI